MPADQDRVDLSESSVHGSDDSNAPNSSQAQGDTVSERTLDRLEQVTGAADDPEIYEGELGQMADELDATTGEEEDALRLNLLQDQVPGNSSNGTGLIADDLSAEKLAELTEVGPAADDKGGVSVAPGRDNTSSILRSRHPNSANAPNVLEGSFDEPRQEIISDRRVDEGTAA